MPSSARSSSDVDEAPVWIAINGVRTITLTCAPTDTDALAAGHLLAEGWVDDMAEITALHAVAGPGGAYGVEVTIADASAERAMADRRHRAEHGCGLRHVLDCVTATSARAGAVPPSDLTAAFRSLFAAADAAAPDGGVHAAALCDGSVLRHIAIDVARHCAVDRAIGLACLAGEPPAAYGLVTSSRISGAIAAKAVTARLRWLASRSIATPLAREIALAGGLPLVERAARRGGRHA
jgi:FdhD protein